MQIPSIPPPLLPNALPQDVVNKAVPNVQAAQPLIQNAVTHAPKGEKSNQPRDDEERSRRRDRKNAKDHRDEGDKDEDHTVNIKV